MFYVKEQFTKSSGGAYHPLFHVEPVLLVLQGIGIDDKAHHLVGRQMLTGKIVHASVLVRAIFVETEFPCGWDRSEVEWQFIHVCFYRIF